MRRALASLTLLAALAAPRAQAYNEAVHAYLTQRAFAGRAEWLGERVTAPGAAGLTAYRARFWQLASRCDDAALRAAFLARFPSVESLDAWSFKELLMLDPAATVHGIDDAPGGARPLRAEILAPASRWPDDDGRNQNRFQRDAQRQIVRGADGLPLPYDPATLALGPVSGLSSQGHAHYGLLPGPLSDDPEVLKSDPRRFAVPPDARSWGAQFAQLYTDLAIVAHGGEGQPPDPWLEAAFAGGAFHHLQDISNQIHTIQVGIFEFFEAAFLQSEARDLETLGGLLGPRRSLVQLGVHIISNQHLLLEDLFAKRVLEQAAGRPAAPALPAAKALSAALDGLERDDDAFAQRARAAMARGGAAGPIESLARELIEESSREGPACYRLIWNLSVPEMHDGAGFSFDGAKGDDPDAFVFTSGAAAQEQLAALYALESKGLRRATTAQRLWLEEYQRALREPLAGQRAVERVLRLVLPYHREAAARRAAWVPAHDEQRIAWGWPLAAFGLLAGGLLLVARAAARA